MIIDRLLGWVKIYRSQIKSHIWLKSSPEHCKILMTLYCMVNHSEKTWEFNGMTVTCKPGQTITSLDAIKLQCGKGISTQNVRSALKRFEKLGILTNESTSTGRRITISGWDDYQSNSNLSKKVNNKQPTYRSQSTNNRSTLNKNGKNDEINLKKLVNQNKKS